MDVGISTHSFRFLCRPEAAASAGLPCPGTFDGLIDLAARYSLSIAEAPLAAEAVRGRSAPRAIGPSQARGLRLAVGRRAARYTA